MLTTKVALGTMALSAAAAASLWVTPARAAEPGAQTLPMMVVTIEGNDAEDQADALTKAMRTAVRASKGWSLAPGDYSLEVLALSMKCTDPPDPQCQARIADQIKSDRYVWGYIKKKGPNVAGELALWVRGKGTTRIPIEYSANLTEANDDAMRKIANDALTQLAGAGPKGGVHVSAGGIVGQLFVDGEPMGALTSGDITLQLPAGQHVIVVKSPGYANAEAGVTVLPSTTSDVALTMVKAAPVSGLSGRKIAGWSLLGGGVALAGAGALMGGLQLSNKSPLNGDATQPGTVANEFANLRANGNGCDLAKTGAASPGPKQSLDSQIDSICSKDKTFSILQFVFYPAAVLAGGAGVYFLVTSPSKPAAPKQGWNVQPTFGPGHGSLDATLTF